MFKMRWICTPLTCAVILCLANIFKPPIIDDTAYLWYVRQIQETPLQPFGPPPNGFPLIWYYEGQSAYQLLTPMVVPYWLAIGMRCFGENIILLKLWLFPFCWLFTASVFALLRRFAPGLSLAHASGSHQPIAPDLSLAHGSGSDQEARPVRDRQTSWERPLLLMTALSPTFLPSVNLMIDIPAISLGLAAIVIFFRAIDASKTNYSLIVLCGLIAGVAAQTKYNAALASAAILWAGILYRRRLPALLVVSLGAAVFIGWEMYLTGIYGRSHFLLALEIRRIKPVSLPPNVSPFERIFREVLAFAGYKSHLAAPLIGNLGGLLPALALLAGVALRVPSRWIYRGMAFVVIGFVLMAIVPEEWSVFSRDGKDGEEVTLRSVFVACTGSMVVVALVCVSGYLGFRGWRRSRPHLRRDRAAWFLIGWALLEIAGYFVLSPFPAARRLMGFVVVATLLTGRLLARTCRSAHRRLPAQVTIVFGVVLGIFFATVDFMDAFPEIRAPAAAVAWIRQQPGGDHRIWFAGHWGFQYAAERAGAEPIFPEAFDPKPGDWLILPIGERPDSQKVYLSETDADLRLVMEWRINLGLRTIPDFYCGHTPMRHQEGPRVAVKVYQWK